MYSTLLLIATIIIVYVTLVVVTSELFPARSGPFLRSTIRPAALLAFICAVSSGFYHILADHEPGTSAYMPLGRFLSEHIAIVVISVVALLIFARQSFTRR